MTIRPFATPWLHLMLMGATLFSRLLGIFLLFLIAARSLAVTDFGEFAYYYSIAALSVLPIDFGFSQSALHEIGKHPSACGNILSRTLAAKVTLTLTVLFALAFNYVLNLFPTLNTTLFYLLFASFLSGSFGEFLGSVLRATGKYHQETSTQLLSSTSAVALFTVAAVHTPSPTIFAAVLFGTKFIHLLAMIYFVREVRSSEKTPSSITDILRTLRKGTSFAADQGATTVLNNLDIVLISTLLGSYSVGIYQAGQKLLQGFSSLAIIVSNVYLPKLSNSFERRSAEYHKIQRQSTPILITLGLIGFSCFWIFRTPLANLFIPSNHIQLAALLPLFGALILLRFTAGALGLILTSQNLQPIRVIANISAIAAILATSGALIGEFQLIGMIFSQGIAILVTISIYTIAAIMASKKNGKFI